MAEVLLITALVLALFFIFFIRPARAAQTRRQRDLNDLRIGDEVLTAGGIIAIVVAVETPPNGPMILHLEIDAGVIVQAHTSAIEERLRTAAAIEAEAALDDDLDEDDAAPSTDPDDDVVETDSGEEPPSRRAAGG